jgi:hypothetical protein
MVGHALLVSELWSMDGGNEKWLIGEEGRGQGEELAHREEPVLPEAKQSISMVCEAIAWVICR